MDADDVNVSLGDSSDSSTDELIAINNTQQQNQNPITDKSGSIIINEVDSNKKMTLNGDAQDDNFEEDIDEKDKNAAIPTQTTINDEEPSLIQYVQQGPFKTGEARVYAIAFALLFYCILSEWFWDHMISDAKVLIDFCDGDDISCHKNPKKIRDGAFTIFFGIFAIFPGIIFSVISAAKGGHYNIGMYGLGCNILGCILIFCGYLVFAAGKKANKAEEEANLAQLFGELAIVCAHTIIMSLDSFNGGFLDDIRYRALIMSSALFAVFGFMIFIGRGIMSDKIADEEDAPFQAEAAVAAGFFIVSITSLVRIGLVYGVPNYTGAESILVKITFVLMAIGGIILVSGYWALADNDHRLYNNEGEEAGIIGSSFFFGAMIIVNVLDMAFAKIVKEVRSNI